jgi:hypothetical protein
MESIAEANEKESHESMMSYSNFLDDLEPFRNLNDTP